jgi:UDP-N-acetylglucosamine 2-epimerase
VADEQKPYCLTDSGGYRKKLLLSAKPVLVMRDVTEGQRIDAGTAR